MTRSMPPAFVTEQVNYCFSALANGLLRSVRLESALALLQTERFAGQTLRVHTHERAVYRNTRNDREVTETLTARFHQRAEWDQRSWRGE